MSPGAIFERMSARLGGKVESARRASREAMASAAPHAHGSQVGRLGDELDRMQREIARDVERYLVGDEPVLSERDLLDRLGVLERKANVLAELAASTTRAVEA